MQGIKRKLVYVTLYEVIATAIITLILLMMGHAILDFCDCRELESGLE